MKRKLIKALGGVLVIASVFTLAAPASAGGSSDNKQTVTGLTPPCATAQVGTGGNLKLQNNNPFGGFSGDLLWADPLKVGGTLTNCSKSLQAYYVMFDEVDSGVVDVLGQKACQIYESGVGDFLLKSGSKTGFTYLSEVIHAGIVASDAPKCYGTHVLSVKVFDRTTGQLLLQTKTTYTIGI